MATVRLAMMVMEKHVRPVPYAPICSALIAQSVTKTPNVRNMQTAHQCVHVDLDILETVLDQTAVSLLLSIRALLFYVETVELALEMERPLIANVHVERNCRYATVLIPVRQVHV